MVPALHSSSAPDGTYLGPATGFVVRFENELTIYFAGDTALFGDMRLIRDRLRAGMSRSCRSAIASRWGPRTRRSPPNGWA